MRTRALSRRARLLPFALLALAIGAGVAYAESGGRGDPHTAVHETFVVRFPPGEAPLDVVGTNAATGTVVVTAELPAGDWQLAHQVDAGRSSGSGLVFCGVRDPERPGFVSTLSRAALGTEPAFVREATTVGLGTMTLGPGGGTVELRCWNFGGFSGTAAVFLGVLQATNVSSSTSTEQP